MFNFNIFFLSFLFFFFFFRGGGGVQKMNIFGGIKFCGYLFWGGHLKIGLVLGVIFMYFRVFSEDKNTESGYFFVFAKISNIFWGCLLFLVFLDGKQ